jgi:starch phosphorylase
MATIPDADLWTLRSRDRAALVDFARAKLALHLAGRGVASGAADEAAHVLDPHVLTIGFARRFAEYKRPTLLLHDPDRLARILLHAERPVQILVAGKAHPGDEVGKQMVAKWIAFVRRADVRRHAVFLEDYDMTLAAQLVRGVDVWLNTPRPPWEACGTSGMKVLVNGGLNVSTLDGWWAEAHAPDVGWAIGDGTGAASDERDAEALYAVLERQVVPEFYARTAGVPRKWLDRMRASMSRLAPQFSCNRMVREYVERAYRPALVAVDARVAEGARVARELAAWEADLSVRWERVRFGGLDAHVEGDDRCFSIEVELGGLDPEAVDVALVADPSGEHPAELRSMLRASDTAAGRAQVYSARFATARPLSDYTPRAIPQRTGVRVPFELSAITWAR